MEKGGVPVISLDYAWLSGKKGEGEDSTKGNPILVMRCRDTKLMASKVVLKKRADPYSGRVIGGHGRVRGPQKGVP